MDKVKFIYFDVGGVMIKDFSSTDEWDKMTTRWGISDDKKNEINKKFDDFEEKACAGEKSVEEFLPILEKDFGIKMPKDYSLLKDFIDGFNKNEGMWKIVTECRKKYKVGLLTAMYPGMLEGIKNRGLMPEIDFVIVDSSIEKCSKPGRKIYEIAQEKSGVKAEEILFVDNREINLVVPREMGWKTFLYDSADYEASNRELEQFLG